MERISYKQWILGTFSLQQPFYLQSLFDPISPDKDTLATQNLSSEDRLQNEFWLLQRLSQVMEKANFYELTDVEVRSKVKEHEPGEGVTVGNKLIHAVSANHRDTIITLFWSCFLNIFYLFMRTAPKVKFDIACADVRKESIF